MKKRCLSLLLVLILALTLLPTQAMAADTSTKASSMALSKTEGTVTVKSASGRTLKLRDGARLYKGYQVTTGEGYAWITLDDTKAVKLDWNSSVTVKKTGQKIELLLTTGSLLFDVTKPLEEDESLNIRTSTMFTGIRGTIGIISVRRVQTWEETRVRTHIDSRLTVLEGAVEVSYSTPETPAGTPETKSFIVEAGQQGSVVATLADVTDQVPAQQPGILDTTAKVETVPLPEILTQTPYVATEVAQDTTLQDRITEAVPETEPEQVQQVQEVLNQADALLRTEEAQRTQEARQKETDAKETIQTITQTAADAGTSATETVFPAVKPPSTSSHPSKCTVSFYLPNGTTLFAETTVAYRTAAEMPLLQPTQAPGTWYLHSEQQPYDFDRPVTRDLQLIWVLD